jgi:peptide/nickel transport system substrate-binding protein|tara:strand:+ start:33675 stop:35594 length:1920 start_codon:yes stop_codon:yes gene_type:complete
MPTGSVSWIAIAALSMLSIRAAGADHEWPQAWFEAPKTATQLGISSFSQSPMLDERDLPPVERRLPNDPVVIVPLEQNGRYGGKARITLGDSWQFFNWEAALTISADMRTFLPNLARSWTVSEDGRVITIDLHPGIRWSDGVPLTSDDFVFAFDNLWLDPEFSPVTSRLVLGGKIVKIGDLSFQYVFADPNPLFVNLIAQYGNFMVDPKHYFRNYHPAYVDRNDLNERVAEMGFISWMALVDALRNARIEESADTPTLRAFRVVSRTPIMMRYERNPYYFKIDPAGQQLPYIDTIEAEVIVDNAELVTAMVASGQLDFAAYALKTQDIPLLKLGERNGAIKVYIWKRLHASDVAIQPNYNYENQQLRDLYWDVRFRHALSYAINRPEMNEIIYFGQGVPRQVTVHPSSVFYDPKFAFAHTEFNPQRARELLDEIGLKDVDGDGMREYPDGSPLIITLEFLDFETPKGISMELVANYWRDVGIDLRLKLVNRSLQSARAQAGAMQMTVWHADRVTDILFPLIPDWWVPRSTGWDRGMWNDWARYYQTDGRLGEEPPAIMKQLQKWTDEMRVTMNDQRRLEVGRKILRVGADNLWVIGTVGLAPHPVVVSKRLKNVPQNGIWGWDNRWTLSYHPATWYLSE